MCKKIECNVCGKATWAGCGQHIDTALQGVAEADRCPGWRSGKCTAQPPQTKTEASKSWNVIWSHGQLIGCQFTTKHFDNGAMQKRIDHQKVTTKYLALQLLCLHKCFSLIFLSFRVTGSNGNKDFTFINVQQSQHTVSYLIICWFMLYRMFNRWVIMLTDFSMSPMCLQKKDKHILYKSFFANVITACCVCVICTDYRWFSSSMMSNALVCFHVCMCNNAVSSKMFT